MKKCSSCEEIKPLKDFYKKQKTYHSYCKKCFNLYCMKRWKDRKIKAIIYKGSKCEHCHLEYPKIDACVFDFHHKDSSKKEYEWKKLRMCSWNKILLELDKCSLLCANCHRLLHKEEAGAAGFEPASSNYARTD